MFEVLGFTNEQAQEQFGFLLDAFKYGAPPHGGIALGLDRLVMLLTNRTNLRDTIAFPKTASATCLLTDAPGEYLINNSRTLTKNQTLGPQQREFHKEIQQAEKLGLGPQQRNFTKKFNRQSKLGLGP